MCTFTLSHLLVRTRGYSFVGCPHNVCNIYFIFTPFYLHFIKIYWNIFSNLYFNNIRFLSYYSRNSNIYTLNIIILAAHSLDILETSTRANTRRLRPISYMLWRFSVGNIPTTIQPIFSRQDTKKSFSLREEFIETRLKESTKNFMLYCW